MEDIDETEYTRMVSKKIEEKLTLHDSMRKLMERILKEGLEIED